MKDFSKQPKGIQIKKGDLVEIQGKGIFRAEEDNEWEPDFNAWGSVSLENLYPPRFTHKGGVRVVTKFNEMA